MRLTPTLAALAAGALALSCISDRADVTAPVATGECRIDVGSGAVGTTIVAIRDFAFHPAVLHVPRGSTITWVNCESDEESPHTSEGDAGGWSSPLLSPGDVYTRTFDAAGSFPYHCGPHPFMTATIVVD
jgi:plastocyanin